MIPNLATVYTDLSVSCEMGVAPNPESPRTVTCWKRMEDPTPMESPMTAAEALTNWRQSSNYFVATDGDAARVQVIDDDGHVLDTAEWFATVDGPW